jgi:uncharacterized DUF497 family protein
MSHEIGNRRFTATRLSESGPKCVTQISQSTVSSSEASTVFADPLSRTISDPLHCEEEDRFVVLGQSGLQHTLVVVHAYRGDKNH